MPPRSAHGLGRVHALGRRALLRARVALTLELRVILGAGGIRQPGWIRTELADLDPTKREDFARYFARGSVRVFLAESCWNRWSLADACVAARHCWEYLLPGGYLRVAVSDAAHPNWQHVVASLESGPASSRRDAPGSVSARYTYRTLGALFESVGFVVDVLEYFDENGQFQGKPWDPDAGLVRASVRFDPRHQDGVLAPTSIVLDARKPA